MKRTDPSAKLLFPPLRQHPLKLPEPDLRNSIVPRRHINPAAETKHRKRISQRVSQINHQRFICIGRSYFKDHLRHLLRICLPDIPGADRRRKVSQLSQVLYHAAQLPLRLRDAVTVQHVRQRLLTRRTGQRLQTAAVLQIHIERSSAICQNLTEDQGERRLVAPFHRRVHPVNFCMKRRILLPGLLLLAIRRNLPQNPVQRLIAVHKMFLAPSATLLGQHQHPAAGCFQLPAKFRIHPQHRLADQQDIRRSRRKLL